MMKIMVTGGNGFIGRHVAVEARRRDHSVRVLTRPARHRANVSIGDQVVGDLVEHDLRQRAGLAATLHGVEAVIHCAASMAGDWESQRADTVEGTQNLLSAMEEVGVGHIVGISTLALYDFQRIPAGTSLNEDSPVEEEPDARGPYVRTKRQQEDLIRRLSNSYDWRWTILRPGIVFGRDRTWSHHLGVKLSPKRWVCYAGTSPLPLTYVENCAEAIVLALETEAANAATLNIVDDNPPERRQYMDKLAHRVQPSPRIMEIPWELLERVAAAASWTNRAFLLGHLRLPEVLRPASLHARCKPLHYSNERAKCVLGWLPRWNLEAALKRTFGEATQ